MSYSIEEIGAKYFENMAGDLVAVKMEEETGTQHWYLGDGQWIDDPEELIGLRIKVCQPSPQNGFTWDKEFTGTAHAITIDQGIGEVKVAVEDSEDEAIHRVPPSYIVEVM